MGEKGGREEMIGRFIPLMVPGQSSEAGCVLPPVAKSIEFFLPRSSKLLPLTFLGERVLARVGHISVVVSWHTTFVRVT